MTPTEIRVAASGEAIVSDEKVNAYFFYEELCGSCRDDMDRFISILEEKLPLEEREQYPNSFHLTNVYESVGRAQYVKVTDDLGIDRDMLTFPLLILGGRIFQGFDSINSNIREAYLTAAEDLYVYERPYSPKARKTGEHLFDDYSINPDSVTIVYFYRITCEECAQVTPIVDSLPKTVLVDGRDRPVDVIRLNTRSGNNGERVAAFFEAWQVPDKDRMVPIIFFSDSYLAGIEAISPGLLKGLSTTPMPWRLLNVQS